MRKSSPQLECSAAFLSLTVVGCPLQLARISTEGEGAYAASSGAEIQKCPVVPDMHHSGCVGKILAAEAALEVPGHE